jgi:hypothetical protein
MRDANFYEPFVDAQEAGKFLALTRRRVLDLARAGTLPGHPIGDGTRRVWRFRLSELLAAVSSPESFGFYSPQKASVVRANAAYHPAAKRVE